MYRPPSRPPQTAWAAHIDAVMRREGLSQTQAFERAQGPLGLSPKSRSAFLRFLVDREPDAVEARALASAFGEPDPSAPAPVSPAELSLQERAVIAAERQAAALERIVELLSGQSSPDPRVVAGALAFADAAGGPSRLPQSGHPGGAGQR